MQAIILAGGRGGRLRPLTDHTPKALIKIRDKELLRHTLDNLPDEIDQVFIVVKHLKEQIIEWTKSLSTHLDIKTIEQVKDLGTFGALLSCQELLKENFLVLNADDMLEKEDLKQLIQNPPSMLVYLHQIQNPYGVVKIHKGKAIKVIEKQIWRSWVSTGSFCLDQRIFEMNPPPNQSGELVLATAVSQFIRKYPILPIPTKSWKTINTLEDFQRIS